MKYAGWALLGLIIIIIASLVIPVVTSRSIQVSISRTNDLKSGIYSLASLPGGTYICEGTFAIAQDTAILDVEGFINDNDVYLTLALTPSMGRPVHFTLINKGNTYMWDDTLSTGVQYESIDDALPFVVPSTPEQYLRCKRSPLRSLHMFDVPSSITFSSQVS